LSKEEVVQTLTGIRETVVAEHNGLFLSMIDNLLSKVSLFGLYFASLDIRQDSSVHGQLLEMVAETNAGLLPKNYKELSEEQKINCLVQIKGAIDPALISSDLHKDTLLSMQAIRTIQKVNGEQGSHRYIISHSTSALNVIEVYGL